MSRNKKIAIAAGLLVGLGAIATVAAQGHRGGWQHGGRGMGMGHDGMGPGMMGDRADGDMRGRGWFNRSLTKDDHETRTRERFAALDKNSDGFIDAAEIEASFAAGQGRGWFGQRMGRGGEQMGARQPGQMLLQRFDTNKDGKVSKDEFLAHVKTRFAEMDLNNDGKIADDDLPPMMRGRNVLAGDGAGPGMGRGRGGMGGMGGGMAWLRGADANKDGVITLEEALAAATKQFDQFDRNKDSTVDTADFDAMKKEMTDYRVKRFIHAFGADKDGKVSKDQFFAKARERFAAMDRNNDGTITRDEMPGRMGMGGGRGGMMGHGDHMGGDGQMGRGMGRGPGQGPGMGPGQGPGMGGNPPEPKKN